MNCVTYQNFCKLNLLFNVRNIFLLTLLTYLAVYKYSRRLLTRNLSPKVLSNNLSLWLSYDWLSLPIFNLHKSHIAQCRIGYNKCFFIFKFNSRKATNARMNMCQYQIHKVVTWCKIPKACSRTYIFQKGFLLGFCAAYVRTFEFSNVKTEIRISQRVRRYSSYKLRLLHELRVTNLSYLSNDRIQKICIAVYLKICNKYILFWQGSKGVCISWKYSASWKSFLKTNKRWN